MRALRLVGCAGITALVTACSDGTSPTPADQQVSLAVATMSADASARDLEMVRAPVGRFGFGFRAERGQFDCTGGSRLGLSVTRTCVFKDAAGNVQTAFDSLTTESVEMHAEVSGTVGRDEWSATIDDVRDYTITGLAGTETQITVNGSGSGTSTRVRETDQGTVTFDMTHSESTTDLVIPVPRTPTSWPLSGTVTRQVTITFTGGPRDGTTETRDVTITYDGTQNATVTVNGKTYTFDLALRGRCRERRD